MKESMKVYHHTDQDGYASAYVVKRKFEGENIDFIPSNYDMEFDFSKVSEGEKVFIVDFSFKPEKFGGLLLRTKDITWIDHHKSVMTPDYDAFKNLAGIREDGTAACVLTWKYLFPDEEVPRAVKLIGDYDIWKFEFGDDTRYFMAATRLYDLMPTSPFWKDLFTVRHYFNKMVEKGKIVLQYESMLDKRTLDSIGYDVVFDGLKCLVANVPFKGSEFFRTAEKGKYDMFVTWVYKKGKYNVSLRETGSGTDVSVIAVKYGGGGHKGAAGFTCVQLPWIGK